MRIKVKVKPGARREKFLQVREFEFDASVKEPAERNEANKRVQRLVSDHFNRPLTSVRFISGMRGKTKVFEVIE